VFAVNAQGQLTSVTNTNIAINGSAVTGAITGSAGSVANALTAGTYLTSAGTYDGSVARTFAVDATSANTVSKVVARDASGNFAAGTITATLSGNATNVSGTVAIANGGSGQTTAQLAMNAFAGAVTSGQYLRGNGTNVLMSTIQAADVPTLNQNTTGSAATLTTARTINGSTFKRSANITITAAATNVNTQLASLGVGTASSGTAGEIRATNNITAYYSDDRLKTRLGKIENALDKLCTLDGFYYEANETAQALGYDVKREVGISAQQMQAVIPEIVVPAPIDEKYFTVRYERALPLLIEAIKELRQEVQDIKKAIEK
jgi:hypothetical protein